MLLDAWRWLLLAAIVYAPLAYGSTRAWAANLLAVQLLVISGLWIAACIVEKRRPAIPLLIIATIIYLLIQGWWMVLNAKFDWDPATFKYQPLTALISNAPGTIARSLSVEVMFRITGLLLVSCAVCDLAGSGAWRNRIFIALVTAGAITVLIGFVQRITDAPSIYWQGNPMGPTFFATFRNHDNAAAFINMIWPIAGALFVTAVRRGERLATRLVWAAAFVVTFAGALVAGSRTGNVIAIVLGGLWLAWVARQAIQGELGQIRSLELAAVFGLLLIIIVSIAIFAGIDLSLAKWSRLPGELTTENTRWILYQVCWNMAQDAGWFGFGPGTFQAAFPYFTQPVGDALKGRWFHAHQDYLQTLIEWGWVGGVAWMLFVLGGIVRGSTLLVKHWRNVSFKRKGMAIAIALGLAGGLLHSLVDFPLQIASIELYAAIFLGLLWGADKWLGRDYVEP